MTETEKPVQQASEYPPDFIDALKFDVARRESEQLALAAVYETIIQWDEGGGKRSRRELARRIVALAEQPAQKRPQNCGTSYCSCIECVMEPEQPLIRKAKDVHGDSDVVLAADLQPAQQQEPFGHVTVRRLSQRFENHYDQYHFYPVGQSLYLDNVDECHAVYTSPPAQRKPQFKEFIKWAGEQGYDCAQTCNSDTGEWIALNPMTADLWKAWQAAHGINGDA